MEDRVAGCHDNVPSIPAASTAALAARLALYLNKQALVWDFHAFNTQWPIAVWVRRRGREDDHNLSKTDRSNACQDRNHVLKPGVVPPIPLSHIYGPG